MDTTPQEDLSYINRHTIQGMMSKRYTLIDGGFRKNKNNVVLFYPYDYYSQFTPETKINISYLLPDQYAEFKNIPHKKSFNGTMVISDINQEFLQLGGKKWHEFREVRNKYDKIVEVKDSPNSLQDILDLIKVWDEIRGPIYGWQRHSGYDINFFTNYFDKEKDNLFSYFFYIDGKLVGYSVISKLGNGINFNYMIRKNNTSFRNLCLYIDIKSFLLMNKKVNKNFTINWGSASGSILKYKRKFPIYKEIPVNFIKLVRE